MRKTPSSSLKIAPTAPFIAIDRGASFTDFVVAQENRFLTNQSIEKRDWGSIEQVVTRLGKEYGTEQIAFTGSGSGMPSVLEERCFIVKEIDAIGFGGAYLASLDNCVIASLGTGTAVVRFEHGVASHLGGTGVGGGTIRGLGAIMLGIDDPVKITEKAILGDSTQVNLTISDLGYETLSFLGGDMTASNFAAPKSRQAEDIAAGILNLVAETIGIIAAICGRESGCLDRIVMVGKVAINSFVRSVLDRVALLYGATFIFPENPGLATVFGAATKFHHESIGEQTKD